MRRFREISAGTRGFTLLEILIAMALLSIVLAMLYSSFFISNRALSGLDDTVLRLQECRMFLDIIRRETESMYFNALSKGPGLKVEDRDIYGKQASRYTFNSFSPLAPGPSTVSYHVDERAGKNFLIKDMGPASGISAGDNGTEILEGVDSFTVEVKDGDLWVKTWDSALTNKFPAEIRITVTVMLKDRKLSFYQVVSPMVGRTL